MAGSETTSKRRKTSDAVSLSPPVSDSPQLKVIDPNTVQVVWDNLTLLQYIIDAGITTIDVQLSARTGAIPKTKPITLYKELRSNIAHHQHIRETRFTRNGSIIITATHLDCVQDILRMPTLLNIPISATILTATLVTKFLLRNIDIDISLTEVGEEMLHRGHTPLKLTRFTSMSDGIRTPTSTILVEEIGYHAFDSLYLWYTRYRVDDFQERPRQCHNCGRFGHGIKTCKSGTRCFRCGEAHALAACQSTVPTCPLCSGAHLASDKNCTAYTREVEALKYAKLHHIPITTARQRLLPSRKTFAQAASPPPIVPCKCDSILPTILDKLSSLLLKIDTLLSNDMHRPPALPAENSIRIDRRFDTPDVTSPSPREQIPLQALRQDSSVEDSGDLISRGEAPRLSSVHGEAAAATSELPYTTDSLHMDCTTVDSQPLTISPADRLKNNPRTGARHPCCLCDHRFTSLDSLTKHLSSHSQDKKLLCPYCGRAFSSAKGLLKHIPVHTSSVPDV